MEFAFVSLSWKGIYVAPTDLLVELARRTFQSPVHRSPERWDLEYFSDMKSYLLNESACSTAGMLLVSQNI